MDFDSKVSLSNHLSNYLGVGFHDVRVSGVELNEGMNGGNPYVITELTSKDGRTHNGLFTISEKALYRLVNFAVCCGIDPASTLTVRQIVNEIRGKWVSVELHEETYNGKTRTKIKNVYKCENKPEESPGWGSQNSNESQNQQWQQPPQPPQNNQYGNDPF